MYRLILIILFVIVGQISLAQAPLPIIRASSKTVTIRDGIHFKKGYWYIMPEKKPDYYFVETPYKEHRVSFITDQDSISFDIKYGEHYDFIVLLNNKDSCHTKIIATYKKAISYESERLQSIPDTIPFTIGNNSKVYFKGRINGSQSLNIQFDLGAGGCQIKKSSAKRTRTNFDNSVTLINSDGTNRVPSSSFNKLEIAGLRWDSLPFAVSNNMTYREDMLVGNSLFQHKVIEINYDKKIIILYDSLPPLDTGYSKHEIILDGVVPYIQASVTVNSKTRTGWFMFDIGAYTTILKTNISATNKMYVEARKMAGLKSESLSPQLTIDDYKFSHFNYTVEKTDQDDTQLGLLGNDLLKRFNVILDNRNGYIYLKPNSLADAPYANPEYYLVRIASGFIILLIALIVFIHNRKKVRRKRV